jgi:hypothetical protein
MKIAFWDWIQVKLARILILLICSIIYLLDRQFYLIKEEGQAVVPADLDAIPIYISGRRKSAGTTGTTVERMNQLPLCNRTSNYSPRIGY